MGKGKAMAGLIMGIVGLVCVLDAWILDIIPYSSLLGLPVAIVGLVLSVSGGKTLRANNLPASTASAGLVLGIIAVVLTAITFVTCGLCDLLCDTAELAGDIAGDALKDALSDLY